MERKERRSLISVTELCIAPARVRKCLDSEGLNQDVDSQVDLIKVEIEKIKKEGMAKPLDPPVYPGRKALEQEKAEYKKERKHYDDVKTAYDKFASPRYKTIKNVHKCCRVLNSLHTLLSKSNITKSVQNDIDKLKADLADASKSHKSVIGAEKYDTADQCKSLSDKLVKSHPGVELFLQKDKVSHGKIRFSHKSDIALSAAVESVIEELFELGMDQALAIGRRIVNPEFCLVDKVKNLKLYPLFSSTPHFRALVAREERRKLYKEKIAAEDEKYIQKTKLECQKTKQKYKKPVIEHISFEEEEVKAGFAVAKTESRTTTKVVTRIDAEGRESKDNVTETKDVTVYEWKVIDFDEVEVQELFQHYVVKLWSKMIEMRAKYANDNKYNELKCSTSLKRFGTCLIRDITAAIVNLVKLQIDFNEIKTVDETLIVLILKQLLAYHHQSNDVERLFEDFFVNIDTKVKLYKDYSETGKETAEHKKVDESEVPPVDAVEQKKVAASPAAPVDAVEQKKVAAKKTATSPSTRPART